MLNRVVVGGRMVADPEVKKTNSDISVCSFSLACDRDFVPKDGERGVDFIDVTAWRSTADFVGKYFTKGRMMIVEGRLQQHNYTDKEGKKRSYLEIVADNVYFGDSKRSDGQGESTTSVKSNSAQYAPVDADDESDLPF